MDNRAGEENKEDCIVTRDYLAKFEVANQEQVEDKNEKCWSGEPKYFSWEQIEEEDN